MSSKLRKSATKGSQAVAPSATSPAPPLLTDLRELILQARHQVAQTLNAALTLLYWHIGTRIRRDLLKERRAEYGARILQAVSARLVAEFGGAIRSAIWPTWSALPRFFPIR